MTITTQPAAVYDALMTHLLAIDTGSPSLPIDVPEPAVTFVRPDDGKYLSATYFPNGNAWEGLSGGKVTQGILLVTVVWPKNLGLVAPMEVAGIVEAHFAANLPLTSSGFRVKLGTSFVAAPVTEPDSVRVPVTVPWTA